jgi:hypothetical protein
MEIQIIQTNKVKFDDSDPPKPIPATNSEMHVSERMVVYDEKMQIVGEVVSALGLSIATGKLKLRIKLFDNKLKERFSEQKNKQD